MKPLVEYLHKLKNAQQVEDLKQEAVNMVERTNHIILQKEEGLKGEIKQLNERCDDLQN